MITAVNGCRWCGVGEREHVNRWSSGQGWHQWVAPTDAQRLERLRAQVNSADGNGPLADRQPLDGRNS